MSARDEDDGTAPHAELMADQREINAMQAETTSPSGASEDGIWRQAFPPAETARRTEGGTIALARPQLDRLPAPPSRRQSAFSLRRLTTVLSNAGPAERMRTRNSGSRWRGLSRPE